MENEIWVILLPIILLPVFFVMGWFVACTDIKIVLRRVKSVPTGLYKSFDTLVDRNSGCAARELVKVIDQQPRFYDLNLTLGKPYRQCGENDEAISMHCALFDSPDTVDDKRERVLSELAQNYQSVGPVDRAGQIFLELLGGNMVREARQHLMSTYQQDRDQVKVTEMAQLLSHDEQIYQFEITQSYRELVQAALPRPDLETAHGNVHKVLDANKKCTRINMTLGDIESKQGDFLVMVAAYGAIEQRNHVYLSMAGEKLYGAYAAQEKQEEGLNVLIGYMGTFPDLDLVNVAYEKSLLLEGEGPVAEATVKLVRRKPDLSGVHRLLGLKLSDMNLAWKADVDMVHAIVGRQLQKNVMYRRRSCYFKSQVFFWRCPACNKREASTLNRIEV